MAKFVFKMQSILNIKEKLESQEKIAYGLARARLNEEEALLESLLKRREELLELKKSQMMGVLSARDLQTTEYGIIANDGKIINQHKAVKRAENALEEQRIKLEQAMREKKTYEKLKEKALEEFKAQLEHEEQMEINELVSYRHGRAVV